METTPLETDTRRVDVKSRTVRRFTFRFDWRYRVAGKPFSVDAEHTFVEIDRPDAHEPGVFRARFGPWKIETSLDNVVATRVTGPYSVLKTIGPAHLSLADHGLTFATNNDCGVCITFKEPVPGIEPLGVLKHPALTVTVVDVEGLQDALDHLN
ncbi:MAG TPA: hypothetical protein VFZ17_08245 [Acidimicrobiia bacterium]|nr:hypothetical protein [Acidimicrobiia bacterium]